jgi:hypothetical protein
VKDKKGLRFTSGPLRLKGRLDVGIKVDELNYKAMFRLYDATFKRMSNHRRCPIKNCLILLQ